MKEALFITVAVFSSITFLHIVAFIFFRKTRAGKWYTLNILAPIVKFQNTLLMHALVDCNVSEQVAAERVSLF